MKVNKCTYYVCGYVLNTLIEIMQCLNLYKAPIKWAFSLLPFTDEETKNQGH